MSTELDQEWIELIQIAIQMEIPIEEIKKIFMKKAKKTRDFSRGMNWLLFFFYHGVIPDDKHTFVLIK